MLTCDSVTCERGGRVIFQGVGFCLPPGGFLLLKGANGSGKTSLINILAGLSRPTGGGATWNGKSVLASAEFKKSLIYIGHRNAVKPECTVEENLAFWANAYAAGPMLEPALRFFGLDNKRDVPAYQLSSGWQRRVALARLLLSRANIWLLDEPTNFLDPEAVELVAALIETRVKHDGIVVAASHTLRSGQASHVLEIEDFAAKDSKL
jgi:heme exporter protein A